VKTDTIATITRPGDHRKDDSDNRHQARQVDGADEADVEGPALPWELVQRRVREEEGDDPRDREDDGHDHHHW
jgi:hypothetical protein